jgi:4-amino-4-deoxy-L-arabinose transferase-like glycosyltransferase
MGSTWGWAGVLIVLAVVLDMLLMRWLQRVARRKGQPPAQRRRLPFGSVWPWPKAAPSASHEAPPVKPPEPKQDAWSRAAWLAAGIFLVVEGQLMLTAHSGQQAPFSVWLNTVFRVDAPNLDSIVAGVPVLVAGLVLIALVMRRLPLFKREPTFDPLQAIALPLKRLVEARLPLVIGGAAFGLLLVLLVLRLTGAASVVLWVAAILALGWAAWKWDRAEHVPLSPGVSRLDAAWVVSLLLLGLVVAAYRLQAVPNIMMGDEGTFWTTARDITRGTYQPAVFDYGVYTYPVLSSIYQAMVLRITEISFWGWRFSSVLAGVAAVVPLYFLAREWFDRRVAVLAGATLVTLPYFLAFARLGYNNIQTLFPVTLAIYAAWIGLRRGSAFYLYLAGAAAGLGFYTYTAGRSGLLIGGLFILGLLAARRRHWRALLVAGSVVGVGWMVVAGPQLAYGALVDPGQQLAKVFESIFITVDFGRQFYTDQQLFAWFPPVVIGGVSLFINPPLWGVLLLRGIARTLLAFQDPGFITEHFIVDPLAGPYTVFAYLLGLAVMTAGWRQRRFQMMGLWFAVTVLTLSAANTFPPRHQHLVGIMPLLAVLIAAGAVGVIDMLLALAPGAGRWAQAALVGLAAAGAIATGFQGYFVAMPAIYRPDLEQIMSWQGLYARNGTLAYVYGNPTEANFEPFVLREFTLPVKYATVAATTLPAWLAQQPVGASVLLFYSPAVSETVQAAFQASWGSQLVRKEYYNREGGAIGEAAANTPSYFQRDETLPAVLQDSYLRPLAGWLLALGVILAGLVLWPSAWNAHFPAWVRRGLEWLAAPPPALEQSDETRLRQLAGDGLPKLPSMEPAEPPAAPAGQAELTAPAIPRLDTAIAPAEMARPGLLSAASPESTAGAPDSGLGARPFVEVDFRLRINLPQWQRSYHWPAQPSSAPRPALGPAAPWASLLHRPEPARLPSAKMPGISAPAAAQPNGVAAEVPAAAAPQARAPLIGSALTWLSLQANDNLAAVTPRAVLIGLLALAAFTAMVAGQQRLAVDKVLESGVALLGAGIILFSLMALWQGSAGGETPLTETAGAWPGFRITSPEIRRRLILASLASAALVAWIMFSRDDNDSHWDVFWVWLASLALYVMAFWPRRTSPARWPRWPSPFAISVGVLTLIGFAVRFWNLGGLPNIMENDEAEIGTQVNAILSGTTTNMFSTFKSLGTMHLFMMAVPVDLFGQTRFAMRLPTVFAGVLAIPILAMLARRLFGRRVALVAAALLTVSHFDVHFSHISATTGAFDVLFIVLALWLVCRALQTRHLATWVAAGLVMGLTMYFYVGARIITIIVVAYLAGVFIFRRRVIMQNWAGLMALAGVLAVAVVPEAVMAVRDPTSFFMRVNQVGVVQSGWLASEMQHRGVSAAALMLEQLRNALLIFNYYDAAWFYNATVPMLGLLTGGLFFMGLGLAAVRLRDERFWLLNVWFWLTLITGQVLMVDPPANAYRTITVLPAACLLAAVALSRLVDAVTAGVAWLASRRQPTWAPQRQAQWRSLLAVLLLAGALGYEAYWNFKAYFVDWLPANRYTDAQTQLASLLGDYLAAQPPGTRASLFSEENFQSAGWSAIQFLGVGRELVDVKGPASDVMSSTLAAPDRPPEQAFVVLPDRVNELRAAAQRFPGGVWYEQRLGSHLYFAAYALRSP